MRVRLSPLLAVLLGGAALIVAGCGGGGQRGDTPDQVYLAFLHRGVLLTDSHLYGDGDRPIIRSYYVISLGSQPDLVAVVDVYSSIQDAFRNQALAKKLSLPKRIAKGAIGPTGHARTANVIVELYPGISRTEQHEIATAMASLRQ